MAFLRVFDLYLLGTPHLSHDTQRLGALTAALRRGLSPADIGPLMQNVRNFDHAMGRPSLPIEPELLHPCALKNAPQPFLFLVNAAYYYTVGHGKKRAQLRVTSAYNLSVLPYSSRLIKKLME